MTRQQLCRLFEETVQRLDPAALVRERLARGDFQPARVVAIGKAAQGMVDGCPKECPRYVISPYPARDEHEFQSSHPFLSELSYQAGVRLLDFLDCAEPVLFLISGGASALVEVCPADQDPQAWLHEWRQWYAAGLDIVAMNEIRARHSAIKGGKLLDRLRAPSLTLLLSDVLQGPRWVGSGLTWREPQPVEHRLEVLADSQSLVAEVQQSLQSRGYACRVEAALTLNLEQAVLAIQEWAPAPGKAVLAGAEVTLAVSGPGRGGRCQHLAARLVGWLRDKPFLFLAAASDGADGPTPAAGACVDGGFADAGAYLARQDSYGYFLQQNEVWSPGPTGNNLNDVLVLLNPRT